tara:strand:- start:35820 stop:36269 length:450 start_codon:yes stop_codon:yes gene_type:complete
MKTREIKKTTSEILDALCNRNGFDDWWYNLDDDIEQEIEQEIFNIIKRRVEKGQKGIWITHPNKKPILVSRKPLSALQLHRKLQEMADDMGLEDNMDSIDITDANPSERFTDGIIKIIYPYMITEDSINFIIEGIVVQGVSEEILINKL